MMNNTEPTESIATLHVAELANHADVTPATVRYYARIGLLSPERESENGYRCFHATDIFRVKFVRQAQSLGLKIGDVKAIFEAVNQGDVPCTIVKSLVESRLEEIKTRVLELQATEDRILKTLKAWDDMDNEMNIRSKICPLIEQVDTTVTQHTSQANP